MLNLKLTLKLEKILPIGELSHLAVLPFTWVRDIVAVKGEMRKIVKKFIVLLNEIPCNLRGRSLFARKW